MVFPGGGVEEYDTSELARQVVPGRYEDFGYRVAALRELAEEVGLALTDAGTDVSPVEKGEALLQAMGSRGTTFDAERLVMTSRWVTPEFAPRRFDTWFYLAEVGSPPPVRLDTAELVDHVWVTARDALDRHEAGDWKMFIPTIAHLEWLAARSNVAEALETAAAIDVLSLVLNQTPAEMT